MTTNDYFIRFTRLTAEMKQFQAWEQVEREFYEEHKMVKYKEFETCKTMYYRWSAKMRKK